MIYTFAYRRTYIMHNFVNTKTSLLLTSFICTAVLSSGILMSGCSSDTKVISGNSGASDSASNTTDKAADPSTDVPADTNNAPDNSDGNTASNSADQYKFVFNGINMACDDNAASIVESLGEPSSYFEEPSCAADGIGKYYTYSDFEIDTYPDGDNDLIMYIILRTDNVATPEGIDLSKTKDDVISVYGDNYTETTSGLNYSDGTTILSFMFDADGYVSSIQYCSAAIY